MVGNGIRNQEKAIIQLRHEIDSICSCIGKEIPAGGYQTCFPSEYGKDFWGKDELVVLDIAYIIIGGQKNAQSTHEKRVHQARKIFCRNSKQFLS